MARKNSKSSTKSKQTKKAKSDGILGINQEAEIQFRGFIDNEEVITSNYVIATDCCHIGLISGDIELVLE